MSVIPTGSMESLDLSSRRKVGTQPDLYSLRFPIHSVHYPSAGPAATQCGLRSDRSELDTGLMSAARNGISFFETNYSKSRQEICVDSLPS